MAECDGLEIIAGAIHYQVFDLQRDYPLLEHCAEAVKATVEATQEETLTWRYACERFKRFTEDMLVREFPELFRELEPVCDCEGCPGRGGMPRHLWDWVDR